MKVTSKFDDEGISIDEVMISTVTQAIQELIEGAIYDDNYEGISGGTEDGNETSEL